MKRHAGDGFLQLIAAFKFCKAAILIAMGLGAFELVRPSIAAEARAWAADIAVIVDNDALGRFLADVTGLSPLRLRTLGVVAFLYATLFVIEGMGLWLARRWAEYLTVVATFSLIPFELYELIRKVTMVRFVALVINVMVAIYLVYRLRRDRPLRPAL